MLITPYACVFGVEISKGHVSKKTHAHIQTETCDVLIKNNTIALVNERHLHKVNERKTSGFHSLNVSRYCHDNGDYLG